MSAGSEVIEGQRTISVCEFCLMRGKKAVRKAVDSEGVLYIFQLAAIKGLRMVGTSIPYRGSASCLKVVEELLRFSYLFIYLKSSASSPLMKLGQYLIISI